MAGTLPRCDLSKVYPPAGISPALAKYIVNRGFGDGGWVALSAACLSLAVKKRLRLRETNGDTSLELIGKGRKGKHTGVELPQGEAALEAWLSGRGKALTLNKDNGTSIQTLGQKFRAAIERESRTSFSRQTRAISYPVSF